MRCCDGSHAFCQLAQSLHYKFAFLAGRSSIHDAEVQYMKHVQSQHPTPQHSNRAGTAAIKCLQVTLTYLADLLLITVRSVCIAVHQGCLGHQLTSADCNNATITCFITTTLHILTPNSRLKIGHVCRNCSCLSVLQIKPQLAATVRMAWNESDAKRFCNSLITGYEIAARGVAGRETV